MNNQRIVVESQNLTIGMYVFQLDRPWSETPFLFQGFEIKSPEEIVKLQSYCDFVLVDQLASSVEVPLHKRKQTKPLIQKKQEVSKKPALKETVFGFLSSLLGKKNRGNDLRGTSVYQNLVPTKEEAPAAIRAFDDAIQQYTSIVERIGENGQVDMGEVKSLVTPVVNSIVRNSDAMAWLVALRKRNETRFNRALSTSVWATVLGRHIGFDDNGLRDLATGGLLLNIGNIRCPQDILNSSDELQEDERAELRQHIQYGIEMVGSLRGAGANIVAMIQHHHERHDGSGYPAGLKGSDIPIYGRIAGIVDCYDAMTTTRPHAKEMASYDAIRTILDKDQTLFQPELAEQLVQAIGMFPAGSLVELNTGEVGIVVETNPVRRLRPKVMVVVDTNKERLDKAKTYDLGNIEDDEARNDAVWIVSGLTAGSHGIETKDYYL